MTQQTSASGLLLAVGRQPHTRVQVWVSMVLGMILLFSTVPLPARASVLPLSEASVLNADGISQTDVDTVSAVIAEMAKQPSVQLANRRVDTQALDENQLTGSGFSNLHVGVDPKDDIRVMDSWHENVPIEIHTALHSLSTQVQSPLEFELVETLAFNNQVLPKGTVFNGTVTYVRQSKRFGRSAKIKVLIEKMVLPNGTTMTLNDSYDKEVVFRKHGRRGFNRIVRRQAFIAAATMAASVLTSAALGLGGVGVLVLDDVADGVIGIVTEFHDSDPEDDRSAARKVVVGFLRGTTALPSIVQFFKKYPELQYEAGEVVLREFPSGFWKNIFTKIEDHPAIPGVDRSAGDLSR
ncbi:MAG: hypothetical protein KC462_09425 [Cyanobacteria bacterium HKST-UBA05]|nr:hypothetical protein [Cyanobacteria bacterium HKST-UBA05]